MKYLIVFIVSFVVSMFITPLVRKFALGLKVVDKKAERKIHTKTVTRLGGLAVFTAFVAGALSAAVFFNKSGCLNYLYNLAGILASGIIVLSIGIFDDIKGAGAGEKFIFQIIASIILLLFGFSLQKFTVPFKGEMLIGWVGIPISVLWLVGMTNAINIIDGLDGLAAGIVGIISLMLFAADIKHGGGYSGMAFVSAALAGATIGFLRYNFFPAKIFMGDSGSLFSGFILASLALWSNRKSTVAMTILVPVIIMGVPIFDTVFTVIRRLASGKHIFKADRGHIHHKLLDIVKDQRKAVLILYLITVVLGIIAIYI